MNLLPIFLLLDIWTNPVVLLVLAIVVLVAAYFIIRFAFIGLFKAIGYVLGFFLPFDIDYDD